MTKPHEVLGSPAPVLFISFPDAVVLQSGHTQLKILILHTYYEYHSRLYALRIRTMLLFHRMFLHFPQQTAPLCQLSSACSCMSALREPLHFSARKKTKVEHLLVTYNVCDVLSLLCHSPASPVRTERAVHWLVLSSPVTLSCILSSFVGQPPFK